MVDTNNRVWAASTPGKRHDSADVRREIFQSSGGASGLVAAGGGGVGLTPGTPMSVRLEPCSVRVRSEYAGRSDEAYSFSVKSPQDVPIRVTGSGAGRTDVVALVVSDPILEGMEVAETDALGNVIEGSEGLDPNDHDYWDLEVFESVPTSAARTTDAFRQWVRDNRDVRGGVVPYAKVVQGANSTGLVGKVTPFFDTILGRYDFYETEAVMPGGNYVEGETYDEYHSLGPAIPYEIPWWATRVKLKVFINGAYATLSSNSDRSARGSMSGLTMGRTMRQQQWTVPADMDRKGLWVRADFIVSGDMVIPPSRRGTTQTFQWRVTVRVYGARLGYTQDMTNMSLEAHFFEDLSAVDNSEPA